MSCGELRDFDYSIRVRLNGSRWFGGLVVLWLGFVRALDVEKSLRFRLLDVVVISKRFDS